MAWLLKYGPFFLFVQSHLQWLIARKLLFLTMLQQACACCGYTDRGDHLFKLIFSPSRAYAIYPSPFTHSFTALTWITLDQSKTEDIPALRHSR